ncbi:hypothetical protein DACRYDRAFT_111740 [Dacryopinax primogenitus]|uniref:Uncharacterized protein n=1 Tax=Dacryopinax primogenitus (strain DJM 731) TaxID=1858805 RepID=M5G1T6_DACPD|nr:uncharacterized protein DACRYDRAFT_111740 [Dacryopinax primogenitus]EJT97692.1 hypothetical protein DACRYDRAFT_111740 [Dacryopinax primogenitus]
MSVIREASGLHWPENGGPPWRVNNQVAIPQHLPIYLDNSSWLDAFLYALGRGNINHDPNSIMHSVSFRFTEMKVSQDTYICAMCRRLWEGRTFENHPCDNVQVIFTSSFFAKWDPTLPATTLADAVTALKIIKPDAEAGKANYVKIWNLVSEFIIYVFFTCRDYVRIDMHRIMSEALLAPVTVSPERHQAIVQILTGSM